MSTEIRDCTVIDVEVDGHRVCVDVDHYSRPTYTIRLDGEIGGIWYRSRQAEWVDNMIGGSWPGSQAWANEAELELIRRAEALHFAGTLDAIQLEQRP